MPYNLVIPELDRVGDIGHIEALNLKRSIGTVRQGGSYLD